jgi:hypothetical protein
MAFTENIGAFFLDADFAIDAVFSLSPSGTRTVKVIFNTPSQEIVIYDTAIEADSPNLMCKTADLASVKRGLNVSVNATNYKIERLTHDGTGVSTVYLK